MNQKVLQRLDIENSLRRAIEKEEFVLFYQPQIDIKTGKIVGFEALLRWYHLIMGLCLPWTQPKQLRSLIYKFVFFGKAMSVIGKFV